MEKGRLKGKGKGQAGLGRELLTAKALWGPVETGVYCTRLPKAHVLHQYEAGIVFDQIVATA